VACAGTAWVLTGTPRVFDAVRWQALAQVREREGKLMRAFSAGPGCLMRFLQEALDDHAPSDCGRCSVCTGTLPGPGALPSRQRLEAARAYARAQVVVIEPCKLWPSGGARRGRIIGCSKGRPWLSPAIRAGLSVRWRSCQCHLRCIRN